MVTSDESTLDSADLSIHEITHTKLVSSTPRPPQPILLRLPNHGDMSGVPLGIEVDHSLPVITYIHPTSPLFNILNVGDVLLELDGVKTTRMGFIEWNAWLAGRSFSHPANDTVQNEERSLLFLRKGGFDPHCIVDGVLSSILCQEEVDVSNMEPEKGYLRQGTGPTATSFSTEEESVEQCTLYLDESSLCTTYTTHDVPDEKVECPASPTTTASTSKSWSSDDEKQLCIGDVDVSVPILQNEESMETLDVKCSDDNEYQATPCPDESIPDASSPLLVFEGSSQSCSMSCKSNTDNDNMPCMSVESAGMAESSASGSDCNEGGTVDIICVDEDDSVTEVAEPLAVRQDELFGKAEQSETLRNDDDNISYSLDGNVVDEDCTYGEASSEEELEQSHITSEDEQLEESEVLCNGDGISYSLDVKVLDCNCTDEEASPEEELDLSHTSQDEQLKQPEALCNEDGTPHSPADDAVGKDCANGEAILPISQDDQLELSETQCNKDDSSHSPTLKVVEEDCTDREASSEDEHQLPSMSQDEQLEQPKPLCHGDGIILSSAAKVADKCCLDEEADIEEMPPPQTRIPLPEEANDWEELQRKKRSRSTPTVDAITIKMGCDEDISTIYGGQYNPSLHASNARIEDGLTSFDQIQSNQYDPNTLSQLKLHGIELQCQHQMESRARKKALEEQDYQMKEARLNLMKRRHVMIEGAFAVFIFVAVVVLIGVVVVILRG